MGPKKNRFDIKKKKQIVYYSDNYLTPQHKEMQYHWDLLAPTSKVTTMDFSSNYTSNVCINNYRPIIPTIIKPNIFTEVSRKRIRDNNHDDEDPNERNTKSKIIKTESKFSDITISETANIRLGAYDLKSLFDAIEDSASEVPSEISAEEQDYNMESDISAETYYSHEEYEMADDCNEMSGNSDFDYHDSEVEFDFLEEPDIEEDDEFEETDITRYLNEMLKHADDETYEPLLSV